MNAAITWDSPLMQHRHYVHRNHSSPVCHNPITIKGPLSLHEHPQDITSPGK